MAPGFKSFVWLFFKKSADCKFVICNLCNHTMRYHTSTSNLRKHIFCKHKDQYEEYIINQGGLLISPDENDSELREEIILKEEGEEEQSDNEEQDQTHEALEDISKDTSIYQIQTVNSKPRKRRELGFNREVKRCRNEETMPSSPIQGETHFDIWAKSIAMQLNEMQLHRALALQLQIQTLVSSERIAYEKRKAGHQEEQMPSAEAEGVRIELL